MNGLVDPSDTQLREWAYNPDKFESNSQDVELLVARLDRSAIILELAADDNCANRLFFLRCAYLIVGNAYRSRVSESKKLELLAFVRKAEKTNNRCLLVFAQEAKALIEDSSSFTYQLWCEGELARRNFKANAL